MNPAFLIETSALLSDGLALSAGSAKTWKQMQVRRYELQVSLSAETSPEIFQELSNLICPPNR